MNKSRYIEIDSNPGSVKLANIPVLDYSAFLDFIDVLMGEEGTHCVTYFVLPQPKSFRFVCCMGADENHALVLFSHEQPRNPLPSIPSITVRHHQFHGFEREIHETTGIGFVGHPWLKPVRYPYNRVNLADTMATYPFYRIEGEQLHEVGVGPIHAGIIEPGYFRFICQGEKVLHLEILNGYQHRGVEQAFVEKHGMLQQSVLAESIAGDTAVGHALAYAGVVEGLSGVTISSHLAAERVIALELERIGIHIGDTAALCADVAYQLGQVVNEALRTIVINTTQLWCGNRFGKGLIRPGGTHYPLSEQVIAAILENLHDVEERYNQITDRIFSLPSVLSRFEGTGQVTPKQATLIGAVGMAARSSGVHRDIRWSHPFAAYTSFHFEPVILQKGDVWSRAELRQLEVRRSIDVIRGLVKKMPELERGLKSVINENNPDYHMAFPANTLSLSLVEGWRGEICHIAVTDKTGRISAYKIKDPSFHNWMALALAVRNQEISDFPLCNKSYNLSYCGTDL